MTQLPIQTRLVQRVRLQIHAHGTLQPIIRHVVTIRGVQIQHTLHTAILQAIPAHCAEKTNSPQILSVRRAPVQTAQWILGARAR